MTVEQAIASLVEYGLEKQLIEPCEAIWATNGLLATLRLDTLEEAEPVKGVPLAEILGVLLDDAASRGVIDGESITQRDILDTALMAVLTPRPSQVIRTFEEKYAAGPEQASRTGTISSPKTPTTSAPTGSPRTCTGPLPPSTASWTSPSTCPSPRRTPRPSRWPRACLRAATPSASSAPRTRATQAGWIIPPGATTA